MSNTKITSSCASAASTSIEDLFNAVKEVKSLIDLNEVENAGKEVLGLMKTLNDLKKNGAEITVPEPMKEQSTVANGNMPKKNVEPVKNKAPATAPEITLPKAVKEKSAVAKGNMPKDHAEPVKKQVPASVPKKTIQKKGGKGEDKPSSTEIIKTPAHLPSAAPSVLLPNTSKTTKAPISRPVPRTEVVRGIKTGRETVTVPAVPPHEVPAHLTDIMKPLHKREAPGSSRLPAEKKGRAHMNHPCGTTGLNLKTLTNKSAIPRPASATKAAKRLDAAEKVPPSSASTTPVKTKAPVPAASAAPSAPPITKSNAPATTPKVGVNSDHKSFVQKLLGQPEASSSPKDDKKKGVSSPKNTNPDTEMEDAPHPSSIKETEKVVPSTKTTSTPTTADASSSPSGPKEVTPKTPSTGTTDTSVSFATKETPPKTPKRVVKFGTAAANEALKGVFSKSETKKEAAVGNQSPANMTEMSASPEVKSTKIPVAPTSDAPPATISSAAPSSPNKRKRGAPNPEQENEDLGAVRAKKAKIDSPQQPLQQNGPNVNGVEWKDIDLITGRFSDFYAPLYDEGPEEFLLGPLRYR